MFYKSGFEPAKVAAKNKQSGGLFVAGESRALQVFSDEEFVKELFSKETPEEAKALLEEKDIDS